LVGRERTGRSRVAEVAVTTVGAAAAVVFMVVVFVVAFTSFTAAFAAILFAVAAVLAGVSAADGAAAYSAVFIVVVFAVIGLRDDTMARNGFNCFRMRSIWLFCARGLEATDHCLHGIEDQYSSLMTSCSLVG
jgi:hypothetical protein